MQSLSYIPPDAPSIATEGRVVDGQQKQLACTRSLGLDEQADFFHGT